MTDEIKPIKVLNFQTERKFSAWFTKLLREEFGEHIVVVNITGTAYGNNGVSDLLICLYGIFFAVELKMNNKKPHALLEELQLDDLGCLELPVDLHEVAREGHA